MDMHPPLEHPVPAVQPALQPAAARPALVPVVAPLSALWRLQNLEPPPPLYPFQAAGVNFLQQRPAGLLADEMGLGKSVQAIAAVQQLMEAGRVRTVLVLCPKSITYDWLCKFKRWAPDLPVAAMYGSRRRRLWDWRWRDPRGNVFICAYETWRTDCDHAGDTWDICILDEVQRIKNPDTQTFRAVAQIRAGYRWGLSGTPVENRIQEMQTIFSFLAPGVLDGAANSAEQIRTAIAPYVLRRRKAEVLHDLPPKHHRERWLDLSPAQRDTYDRVRAQGTARIRRLFDGAWGGVALGQTLGLITHLKEICNLDPLTGASAKLQFLLQELPPLLARGEKVVVFSQFPAVTLQRLLPQLLPLGAALFSGACSQYERDELVRLFQDEDWPQVMLMSLRAGGIGLTLSRANHVYHFDHWWNPAVMVQAEDRVHRIGQHRHVYVTSLLTRNTIEERIHKMLQDKRELLATLMADQPQPKLDRETWWQLLEIAET